MLSNWLARVGSAIPRGFSRHYILGLLEEEPMTGKKSSTRLFYRVEEDGSHHQFNLSNVRETVR